MAKKKGTKKKAGGAKKKASKAASAAGTLTEMDQLTRTVHELSLIRTELAEQQQETRRASHKAIVLQEELEERDEELEERQDATVDITTDLTRQYKLMQSQLMAKILDLQENCRVLTDQLGMTRQALAETKEQAHRAMREKDDLIAQLTQRIESMESAYEGVLNEALDAMASRVEQARDKWEVESYVVQQRNKDVLMEFGLSHVAM